MFEALHDQFIIARAAPSTPANWQAFSCRRWRLAAHPSLPVRRIRTADGGDAGFALGHLIDRQGEYLRSDLTLPAGACPDTGAPDFEAIEDFLYQFGGRFACLVLLPDDERMYLDPFGSLATVWCPQRERVASTPTLLLHDEPGHPIFRADFRPALAQRANQYFPAGLTAVPGIHRVVTNHFLDLRTWTMSRHHPRTFAPAAEADIPGVVASIQQGIARQVAAVVRECGGAYIALTAGRDSRRVLACARELANHIACFTLRSRDPDPGMKADIDYRTARAVARLAGVRHWVAYMGDEHGPARARYLLRIGYSGGPGKAAKFADPPLHHLDLSRGWMTGHGGGFCFPRYFRRLRSRMRFAPDEVIRLLKLRPQPGFADAIDRWLAGLPDVPPTFALDLTVIENRGGGWLGPHLYGTAPFRINLMPVTHRAVVDAVFSLPISYRTSGALDLDLFARAWPELLQIPFNEYVGLRRWVYNVRRQAHL